jgi:hypothetical protein
MLRESRERATSIDGGFASIPQMIVAAQHRLGQEVCDHLEGAADTEITSKRNRLGLIGVSRLAELNPRYVTEARPVV